ncbi:hypothetical protein RB195_021646 [Necator americanus]|uniref:Uncharacterized protein n=1 Tax=Necator americanus TaxID=51031 RepID=A0ABR1EC14_NECAM
MDHGASIALLIACIVVLVESRYYDIENVADGHLRKHHAHDVKHHMKRAKPIETDYVGIDQHGQAYVNCTYNMDGVVGVRKCSMPASDAAFDMGLACFALWNGEGEIIAQDCWIHQEKKRISDDDFLREALTVNKDEKQKSQQWKPNRSPLHIIIRDFIIGAMPEEEMYPCERLWQCEFLLLLRS